MLPWPSACPSNASLWWSGFACRAMWALCFRAIFACGRWRNTPQVPLKCLAFIGQAWLRSARRFRDNCLYQQIPSIFSPSSPPHSIKATINKHPRYCYLLRISPLTRALKFSLLISPTLLVFCACMCVCVCVFLMLIFHSRSCLPCLLLLLLSPERPKGL